MRTFPRPRLSRTTTPLLAAAAILLGACADAAPTGPAALTTRGAAVVVPTPLLHWAPAVNAPAAGAFAAAPDGRLFAAAEIYGLLVADRAGQRWSRVSSLAADVSPFSVAVAPDGAIYVGSDKGVARSTDGGATWATTGLAEGYVRQVAIDDKGTVYAGVMGMGGGVLRSDDAGATWTMVFGPFVGRGGIIDFLSVRRGDVILGLYSQLPVWSRDGGTTWEYLTALWELPDWNAFANDMLETANGSLLATWPMGIARSVDGGQSFQHVFTGGNTHKLAQDPASGALYAMLDDGSTLRSIDDGITWSLFTGPFRPLGVVALAAAPDGGLVLGTWEGIWRTVP